MPRKTKSNLQSSSTTGKKPATSTQWLNYKLAENDVPAVLAIADEQEAIADGIIGLLSGAADVQVRYNADRENWSAFAIYPVGEGTHIRYAISAYGGNQWEALASLLYKCDLYARTPEAFAKSGQGMGIG